ncbi:MAG: TolC family protein [Desulfotalea sp.]
MYFKKAGEESNTLARLSFFLSVIFSILAIFGCASKKTNVALPGDIPTTWGFTKQTEPSLISERLLDLLGDPQIIELAQEALANNPNLGATSDRLLAQAALLGVSGSRLWPTVNLDLAANRGNQGFNDLGEHSSSSQYSAGLGISWELDLWGKIRDEHNANRTSLEISRMEYSAARDSLISRTIQSWVRTVSLSRSVDISGERVSNLETIQERILSRYQKGIGSIDELSTIKTRIYTAKAEMSELTETHAESIRELELLLGRYPDNFLNPGKLYPELILPVIFEPGEVLVNRPDVYIALKQIEAAELQYSAAEKAYLPSFLVTGKLLKENVNLASITSGAVLWGMVLSASQPIFNAGKIESKIEARSWEKSAAVKNLKLVVLKATGEVKKYWGIEQMLTNKGALLESAGLEANRSYTYFEKRYLGGLDSIVNMLNAKEEQITIKAQINELQAARLINRINLALALGLGENNGK